MSTLNIDTEEKKKRALFILMAEVHDASLSDAKLNFLLTEVEQFSAHQLERAWRNYRRLGKSKSFPTTSELIENLQDDHPSVQEAWSMIPKDEYRSVVWTEEMRKSYALAVPFLENNNASGAWFAFHDSYVKLLARARFNNKPARWSVSFGMDKSSRETVMIEAVEKKRMSLELACEWYPELKLSSQFPRLAKSAGLQLEESNQKGITLIAGLVGTMVTK